MKRHLLSLIGAFMVIVALSVPARAEIVDIQIDLICTGYLDTYDAVANEYDSAPYTMNVTINGRFDTAPKSFVEGTTVVIDDPVFGFHEIPSGCVQGEICLWLTPSEVWSLGFWSPEFYFNLRLEGQISERRTKLTGFFQTGICEADSCSRWFLGDARTARPGG